MNISKRRIQVAAVRVVQARSPENTGIMTLAQALRVRVKPRVYKWDVGGVVLTHEQAHKCLVILWKMKSACS